MSTENAETWQEAGNRAYNKLPFWRKFLLLADPSAHSTWIRAVNQQALIKELTTALEAKAAALDAKQEAYLQEIKYADGLERRAEKAEAALDGAIKALRTIRDWPRIGDTTSRLVDIRAYAEAAIAQAETAQ